MMLTNDMKPTPGFTKVELATSRKLNSKKQGSGRIALTGFRSSRSLEWKWTWLAVAILGLLAHNANAAQAVDSARQNSPWLQEHLLNSTAHLPFSFVYGRQSSQALLKVWPRKT